MNKKAALPDWSNLLAALLAFPARVHAKASAWADRMGADPRVRRYHAGLVRLADRHVNPRNLGIAVAVVLLFNVALYLSCGLRGCPDPAQLTAYQPGGASELFDRRGRKFADLAPVEREVVKLSGLPSHVASAFIAVEDKRFLTHHGVDWRRVGGAALNNLKSGGIAEGSSTITMQLSRNIFSDRLRANDRSMRRKIYEARVAKRIESSFTKREILELYLNHIYFGGGAYGIQAASRHFFDKPASKLDLDEAAMLAALPKSPSNYDPRRHPERAKARRDLVIGLMEQQSLIGADAAATAREHRLGVDREPPGYSKRTPLGAYFAQMVRDQVEEQLGERMYREKLRVHTTLDANAQRAVEEELARQISAVESGRYGTLRGERYSDYDKWTPEGPQYLQGAAVVMESASGDVIALVGGRDFRHSRFNRATRARRQTGSAFKPFVFGAALEEGYVPSQPIMDTPYRLANDGTPWEPRNYDGRFMGSVSMREALVYSRNVPAVRLAAAVGPDNVAAFAHAAGIRGEIKNTPMIALGITEATPLELVRAYGAFAGLGTRAEPRYVTRVENAKGDILWETESKSETAIHPGVAFVLTHMLFDVVNHGTGTAVRDAGFEGMAAGKTGTTSDGADTWFVGYTPDLIGGVWLGFDQRSPLPGEASGGSVAAPAWGRMMSRIYKTRPVPQRWPLPETVVERAVDPASGLVLEPGCRPTQGEAHREIFLVDEEPDTICPAGSAEDGQNVLDKILGALSGLFGGGDDQPEPVATTAVQENVDENLGRPRVTPRRVEAVDQDSYDRPGKGNRGKRGKKDRD